LDKFGAGSLYSAEGFSDGNGHACQGHVWIRLQVLKDEIRCFHRRIYLRFHRRFAGL
jgi:hypothetical protein